MPIVAAGVIIGWPSSAAAIPAGWSRVATLDGQYLRSVDVSGGGTADPGGGGGTATHTHTGATGHTHAIPVHAHTGGSVTALEAGGGAAGNAGVSAFASHQHSLGDTDVTASTDTLAAATTNWDVASSEPAALTVLFLQSDGSPTGIPPYALAMFNSATLPVGWVQHPVLKNAYLKGAAAASDGGIAISTAGHAHTGLAHAHGAMSTHTHPISGANLTTGAVTQVLAVFTFGSPTANILDPSQAHTHAVTTPTAAASGAGSSSDAGGISGTAQNDPPYIKLAHIQNSTGANSLPISIIAVWLGTIASIPSGWYLCNGSSSTPDVRGNFIKGANALAEIGATGGSLGHTHTTGSGHTHASGGAHTHGVTLSSVTQGAATITVLSQVPLNEFQGASPHDHAMPGDAGNNVATATPIVANGAQDTTASTDSRPPFVNVAFIQYQVTNTATVTTPTAAQVFALPSFTAAWTLGSGTQVTKRAVVYANDGVTIVYDSGTIISATQTQLIPAGFLVNGTSYKFQVTITDTNGATAQSSQIAFSTSWTNPAGVGGLAVTPSGGT